MLSSYSVDADTIKEILEGCGYNDYSKLYISSVTGYRKDTGEMWDKCLSRYQNNIHVGDNEESDVHLLVLRKKDFVFVMSGSKMFDNSSFRSVVPKNLDNRILIGLIANKSLYNSPFAMEYGQKYEVNDLKKYGYSILGPIFLYFFSWIDFKFKKKKNNKKQKNLINI